MGQEAAGPLYTRLYDERRRRLGQQHHGRCMFELDCVPSFSGNMRYRRQNLHAETMSFPRLDDNKPPYFRKGPLPVLDDAKMGGTPCPWSIWISRAGRLSPEDQKHLGGDEYAAIFTPAIDILDHV